MHREHVYGSKYLVFFGIFPPPLTYWEYYHLSRGNHLVGSSDKYSFIPLWEKKDFILVSLCFSPQCFSEEDDMRVSLVLFSKYAHLSLKKKNFSPF